MPEAIEVELYRRALDPVIGETVTCFAIHDLLVAPDPALEVLVGERVTSTRRHGKLLLVETTGAALGLHFGMTGRLVVDGRSPIDRLAYGPHDADERRFDRVVLYVGECAVRFSDPRRFGRVSLDPDHDALGPDVWTCTLDDVRRVLAGRRAPVKAVLLDQSRLAGLGNMLADELLCRAGIDPRRAAGSLDADEVERLHRLMAPMLDELMERGGSHAGNLSVEHRRAGGRCPNDGEALSRRSIGGRTTWWCPAHQT